MYFLWKEIERAVRIEGPIRYTTSQQADEYFYSRPRGSQVAAAASPQSSVVDSKEYLDKAYKRLDAEFRRLAPASNKEFVYVDTCISVGSFARDSVVVLPVKKESLFDISAVGTYTYRMYACVCLCVYAACS
jgi:hypothetical protein